MNIIFRTCAQFTILFTSPTQHYCALPPSLLERGNGGEDSSGASLQLVPNSKFIIQNSQFYPVPHTALLRTAPPLFWRGGTGVRIPLAQACSSCPIQNSEFKIHNSLFCRCKDNFFLLYYQDIVPLHLEVTEKIGTIK